VQRSKIKKRKIMKTLKKQIEENEAKIKALNCNQYGTPVDMDFANKLYEIEENLINQLNSL
jgi:hypothetical protein